MDKDILVTSGHSLIIRLDETPAKPRAAMWVHNPDSDIWRLWIVTQKGIKEPEFYRIVADAITKNREILPSLDISSVELIEESHPAIVGLRGFMRMDGLGSAFVSNNTMNGFFLPDGIILRMSL